MKAKFTGRLYLQSGAVKSASLRAPPHIQPAGARAHRPQANPMARPMKRDQLKKFPSSRDPVTSADSALPSTWPVPRICASSTPTNRVTLMKILHLLAVTLATLTAALPLANPRPPKRSCADGYTPAAPGSGSSGCVPIPGLYQVPGGTGANPLPHPSAGKIAGARSPWTASPARPRVAGSKATRQKGRRSRAGNMRQKGAATAR